MANSEQTIYVNMNTDNAASATQELEKELLVLRLAFGKLKAEVNRAVAPMGAVFVPMMQKAVWAATRLVKSVGKVVAALFGYIAALKTTVKTQEKMKHSLMDFDELNRLEGSGGSFAEQEISTGTLDPQLQTVVDKILSLLAPLRTIDFAPTVAAFGRLKEAIAPISQALFAGLEWAWFNLLVPLAKWTAAEALPIFLDTLTALLNVLNTTIIALQPGFEWLWESFLKPVAQWTGEKLLNALGWLRERLDGISGWIAENPELTGKILLAAAAVGMASTAMGKFNITLGDMPNPLSLISGGVAALVGALVLLVGNWDRVTAAARSAWSNIKALWGPAADWFQKTVLSPLSRGFKGMVNGIIGFLNAMIAGIVSGVNGIVNAVNKLSFTAPDWIPGIGGKTVGFNLKTVRTPQIPYLAQGAVLPANKPFLAVVGDQKHGTNVEAPLETIQQAVAAVMHDQTSAILAGFATSVEVQREILQAVLGIQIGDEVIGNAMTRYRQKMAVVNGGLV